MATAFSDVKSTPLFFIGTAFIVATAVLYEWGYWGRFGINILQFMSFSDVVSAALYPFLGHFAAFFLGALLGLPEDTSDASKRAVRIVAWISKRAPLMLAAATVTAVAVFIFGGKNRWLIPAFIVILVAMPIASYHIGRLPSVQLWIPHSALRTFVIYIAVSMPVYAFALGATQAEAIINDRSYQQAKIEGENRAFKYLGHAGSYVVLLTMDNKEVQLRDKASVALLKLTLRSD